MGRKKRLVETLSMEGRAPWESKSGRVEGTDMA
jgi:hypothetical protein